MNGLNWDVKGQGRRMRIFLVDPILLIHILGDPGMIQGLGGNSEVKGVKRRRKRKRKKRKKKREEKARLRMQTRRRGRGRSK